MRESPGVRFSKALVSETMNLLQISVWCALAVVLWPSTSGVKAEPISIDFSTCQPATYASGFLPSSPNITTYCCPPEPTRPIVDGLPPPTTTYPRVRRAAQCTDQAYKDKLAKAYELMRALPDDDPRSMTQQWHLHCAYCGGSFLADKNNVSTAIDIHYSWFFLPWHRFYLYFHERILQGLVGDPTLSLNYWNWDAPYSVDDTLGSDASDNCLKAGIDFPDVFSDPSTALFDVNRSDKALGKGRLRFPDLSFSPLLPTVMQPLYNASSNDVIDSNLNILYNALVSGGTTTELFMGKPYRKGDLKSNALPGGGAGSLEQQPHAGVHFWTGHDPPYILDDMGALAYAARDPVFYAHHGNLDRLFQVWKDIGPYLKQDRDYWWDSDFLNAEFLFWDENKDLRRVKLYEALDTTKMGYVYQGSNIDPWLKYNATRCQRMSYSEIIIAAQQAATAAAPPGAAPSGAAPAPAAPSGVAPPPVAPPGVGPDGKYHLQAGVPLIVILDRPDNPRRKEEFINIAGIQLDNCYNAGFDVYTNILNPGNFSVPTKCAEYTGRYMNMAQATRTYRSDQTYDWKQSISRTLVDIRAPSEAKEVVITVSLLTGQDGAQNITFTSIFLSMSS